MKFLLALLALVAFANAELEDATIRAMFDAWKAKHSKQYQNEKEHVHRLTAFAKNARFVHNWDAEARGFQVGLNAFADLHNHEFRAMFNGMNITKFAPANLADTPLTAPATQDWSKKGAVTGVKNQGQCGSCWSFSTTGSVEGRHFLSTGKLVSLSEQNLVDCSVPQGNQGCNGGLMDQAFQYIIQNKGIDTEKSYPYTATGPNQCRFSASNVGATIGSYTDVSTGSEIALQNAVGAAPVSVAIDASHESFQLYTSGIYNEPACSSSQLDHGVLAVGYNSLGAGSDYWIVKNSWGTGWGQNGYIWMTRNQNNQCGIATAASFPTGH
jgi:cathepsin L